MEATKNHMRARRMWLMAVCGERGRQAAGRMGDDNSNRRYPTGHRLSVSPTTARPNLPLVEASLESVLTVANWHEDRQGQREIASGIMNVRGKRAGNERLEFDRRRSSNS